MSTYFVHVTHDWTYAIEAESPEDAARVVDEGEAPTGECTGYSIEAVTATWDGDDTDLRSPIPCRGGCGTMLAPSSNGKCTPCIIVSLERWSADRS